MNQLFNKGVPFYDNGASTCRGGSSFSSLDFRMGMAVKKTSPAWFILTRYIYTLLKRKIETDMTLFT